MSPVTGHSGDRKTQPSCLQLGRHQRAVPASESHGTARGFLGPHLCLNPPAAKSHFLPSTCIPRPPNAIPRKLPAGKFPSWSLAGDKRKAAPQ